MLLTEGRFCFADCYDVHAVEVFAIPIPDLFHHLRIGPVGGEKRPDYGRDLAVLPSDKNKYVVIGHVLILSSAACGPSLILKVETHVDRQAKPYRGWLDRREWPNVVVEPAGVLFRVRKWRRACQRIWR